jgi:hypothetical protein
LRSNSPRFIIAHMVGRTVPPRLRPLDAVTVHGRPAYLLYFHRATAVIRYTDERRTRVVPLRSVVAATDAVRPGGSDAS